MASVWRGLCLVWWLLQVVCGEWEVGSVPASWSGEQYNIVLDVLEITPHTLYNVSAGEITPHPLYYVSAGDFFLPPPLPWNYTVFHKDLAAPRIIVEDDGSNPWPLKQKWATTSPLFLLLFLRLALIISIISMSTIKHAQLWIVYLLTLNDMGLALTLHGWMSLIIIKVWGSCIECHPIEGLLFTMTRSDNFMFTMQTAGFVMFCNFTHILIKFNKGGI